MKKRKNNNADDDYITKENDLYKDVIAYIKRIKKSGLFPFCTRDGNTQYVHQSMKHDLFGIFFDRESPEPTLNPTAFIEVLNTSKPPSLFIVVEAFDKSQDAWFNYLCVLLQEKLTYILDHVFVVFEYAMFNQSMTNERYLDSFIAKTVPFVKCKRLHYGNDEIIGLSFTKDK